MEKTKKLAQIAEAVKLLESLVKEYNESINTYDANISSISIATVKDDLPIILLSGNTDYLDIDFRHKRTLEEKLYDMTEYDSNFCGVYLSNYQFKWHEIEKETGDNAKMAV